MRYGGRPTAGVSPLSRAPRRLPRDLLTAAAPRSEPHRPSGVRSGAVLALASVFAIGLNYAFLLAAGRLLGSEDYGALSALLGLLTLVLLPAGAVQLAVSREALGTSRSASKRRPMRSVGPHSASRSSRQRRSSWSRSCSHPARRRTEDRVARRRPPQCSWTRRRADVPDRDRCTPGLSAFRGGGRDAGRSLRAPPRSAGPPDGRRLPPRRSGSSRRCSRASRLELWRSSWYGSR